MMSTSNFNIGSVDEQVIESIKLQQSLPVIVSSNFQNNDESIAFDDLELSKYLNEQLQDLAGGSHSSFLYIHSTADPAAWHLSGRYTVKDSAIVAKINVRQNKVLKEHLELTGSVLRLKDFSKLIVEQIQRLILAPVEPGRNNTRK
jgi:hypothetical protein